MAGSLLVLLRMLTPSPSGCLDKQQMWVTTGKKEVRSRKSRYSSSEQVEGRLSLGAGLPGQKEEHCIFINLLRPGNIPEPRGYGDV